MEPERLASPLALGMAPPSPSSSSFGQATHTDHVLMCVTIAQTAVSGICLIAYNIHLLVPWAPRWMRPFAKEETWRHDPATAASLWPWLLLVVSVIGLFLEAADAVLPPVSFDRWLGVIPWAVACFVTVMDQPQKTPKTLLVIFLTTFLCGIVTVLAISNGPGSVKPFNITNPVIAALALLIVLIMPMRDPGLDNSDIGKPGKPPTSQFRSPEDNLSLLQFMTVSWMTPLIRRGYKNQLNDEDVWLLPYEFQHERLHVLFRDLQGSMIKKLLVANGLDLIIITFLGVIEAVANLSTPVLLRSLLQSIQRGHTYKNESVYFALAIMAARLIACQSAVFSIWYSRRAYERSRGEMLTTIYAKTLSRKSGGALQDEKDSAPESNGHGIQPGVDEESPLLGGTTPKKTRIARALDYFRMPRRSTSGKKPKDEEHPATMGKILNLMRSDVYEVAQRFWEFPTIVTKPLQLVLSIVLVWKLLGWPCLLGIVWVGILQVANGGCVRMLLRNERLRRTATDVRLQVTSQFVEAIRHLRWYDWQSKWLANIMEARDKELHLRIVTGLWTMAISTTNIAAGALFPVFAFLAYTYIAKNPLTIDVAFPALQLFTMLETSLKEVPTLITTLLNAHVAMGRLEAFMREPDKEEAKFNERPSEVEFSGASFAWPGYEKPVLRHLRLRFSTGLAVVFGKVGCGKSALLQAILGELDLKEGQAILPNEMVGFCAQSPWLQNMSIRDNILFNFPFDPIRYKKVLDACALTPDLANFKQGDLSHIGENGIGLSGGQKARVALARAVYSNSKFLLLDDPLAALDHQTAESIVNKLLRGSLLKDRTVVLVTHRVDLCTHLADQVVEIRDRTARLLTPEDIASELNVLAKKHHHGQPQNALVDATSTEEEELQGIDEAQAGAAVPDKFIEDEHRASGGVVARVYWTYIKAGKLTWWSVLILIFALFRFSRVFNSWFLKAWGEAYGEGQSRHHGLSGLSLRLSSWSVHATESSGTPGNDMFDGLPDPRSEVAPWLMWYAVLGLATTVLFMLMQCGLLLILYVAARDLFVRVIRRVSNANFRFYDVTPVGRLMNRLTSDVGMVDGGILTPLQNVAFWAITWFACMVVIAMTTPIFCAFALVMTLLFVLIFLRFLPTSQSLRRLEMVSLSPLMSNFGILVDGLATIRAFRAQPHFQRRNIDVTDAFQKMDHFYWSLQAWLMYRFDSLSALSTFVLTMLALYQELSPGLTAFVLTTASQFVDATHALCKVYGQLQMDFVSVERVVELLDLEEEPAGRVAAPATWPSRGDAVVFENVSLKYAPHLEPSLREVNFTIPGGATCAVLGRTGSGKSTLALALLATMHPEAGGRIRVGDMDLAEVDVHAWRQRISFVAQDPVLFPGTLRENLDPLKQHTDVECISVVERVLGPVGWDLDTLVEAGGKNLSQGQRQLVGIGRAVLRRSPVVVLDEATASIDRRTAIAIQDVLRDELRTSTVITIAHRLEAVKDADYLIRLDAGRVIEAGPASNGQ